MLYRIIFLEGDRFDDTMWLSDPKVGDIVKIGMLSSRSEELEYWTIVEVSNTAVKVKL